MRSHRPLPRSGDPVVLRVLPTHDRPGESPVEVRVHGPLYPGPIGPRLAVYDYDRDRDSLAPPARPNDDGSFPAYDTRDPRFRQLNAYAVAARAIHLVEDELGRMLRWGFEGSRLNLLPHAGCLANAFYEEATHSLQFFSFQTESGRVVHTSAHHDIVAHETGHALLDAVRDRFTESAEPQTGALHEAIGDVTAMFASLSHRVVRERALREGRNDLRRRNQVAEIAEEWEDDPAGGTIALRNLSTKMKPSAFRGVTEPHVLSLQVTQAVYDALCRIYGAFRKEGLEPERALAIAHRGLQRMVVRGLDYLPPVDATFVDFARAMLRADRFAHPEDPRRFRPAVADAFVESGIGKNANELLDESGPSERWGDLGFAWPRLTPVEAYALVDAHRDRLAIRPDPEIRDFVVSEFHVTKDARRPKVVNEVILLYEYPVDVELRGREAGALRGRWVTLFGGGTLVFDAEGGLRHHAEKPVTSERVEALREFFGAGLAAAGVAVLGSSADDAVRRAATREPYVAEVAGDRVALRLNPAARCGGRRRDGRTR